MPMQQAWLVHFDPRLTGLLTIAWHKYDDFAQENVQSRPCILALIKSKHRPQSPEPMDDGTAPQLRPQLAQVAQDVSRPASLPTV
jgi:hypothetical protein